MWVKEWGRERERNHSFLHEYGSLIGHCAFNWADAGAAADARSSGKIGFETRGKFPLWNERWSDMGKANRTKKQVGHFIWALLSLLPNPIPYEMRHIFGNINLSQHWILAPDLSSTGIIIDTSGKCRKAAQGYREHISLLVCHSYILLLSCSTVAPSEPNRRKQTKRTCEGERRRFCSRGDAGTKGWTELNSGFTQRVTHQSNAEWVEI